MSALREGAVDVVRILRARGRQAYWVGGCVRDLEMGREPHDYDVVTDAPPDEVAALFPRALLVGAQFGVVVVPYAGSHYEVSTFRTEGPYLDGRRPSSVQFADAVSDVRRRDFTVNGLLHDPLRGETIDHVGGRADIAARRIRTIGDPAQRFAEDRLRMLRAVRLAAELDFEIDGPTFDAVRAHAGAIGRVSAERIRDELIRLLVSAGRGRGVVLLRESGLLAAVLPEVDATAGVPQPPEFHPEGDVFTHTVLALEQLRDPHPALALAVLLHDVGKPRTMTVTDRIRFNDHDEVGARMAEAVCGRLRCSTQETDRVAALVREHLRIKDLPQMRPAKAARFLLREDADDHLELHRADCLASHRDLTIYTWALQARDELRRRHPAPPRLLTGEDLIAMGYRPGPRFKEILEAVTDAQLEGAVGSAEEARAFVRRTYGGPEGSAGQSGKPLRRGDQGE